VFQRESVELSSGRTSDRLRWLDFPDPELLRPAPEDHLQMWKVTPAMNSSRYREADAIVRID
jgi:putative SOS response-associated peptidase YedK